MTKAVFPGSFDPMHNGHLKIIKTVASIYKDGVIVLVSNSSAKEYTVTLEKRFKIAQLAVASLGLENVTVEMQKSGETTPKFAKRNNITDIIRGLRESATLNAYESNLAEMYLDENPNLKFHYVVVPESLSGTEVRSRLRQNKSITDLVAPSSLNLIEKEYKD